MLASVVGLLLFFIFVYAVAGTMLFMNVFHQKCFDADGKPEEAGDDEDMYGCGNWRTCPTGYTCEVIVARGEGTPCTHLAKRPP